MRSYDGSSEKNRFGRLAYEVSRVKKLIVGAHQVPFMATQKIICNTCMTSVTLKLNCILQKSVSVLRTLQ